MRKSIRFTFLFLVLSIFSILVACKPEVVKSLTISEESVEVEVGQEVKVDVILENLDGEVLWEITDSSVASVKGGVVTGLSIGETILKASLSGYEDSLTVKVIAPSVVGTLSVDYETISLNEGSKLSVNASVSFKGEKVEGLEYVWTENSNGSVVSLNANGGKCEVTATGFGESVITVKTNHFGVDLTKTITVSVIRDVSVEITNIELGDSGYILDLVSFVPEGTDYISEFIPDVKVLANGEELSDINYSLTADNDVVVIEGNKIRASKEGSAVVTLTYQDVSGNVELVINVNVTNASVSLEKMIDFDKDANLVVLNKNDFVGNILGATLAGEELTVEVAGDNVNLSGYSNVGCGEADLVVKTDNANYSLKALVISMIIDSKEDLDRLGTVSRVGDSAVWDGYYVLGCDIEYNGVFNTFCGLEQGGTWGGTTGFVGTFDGRGHVIKGFQTAGPCGGLIGTIGTAGVVKNVGFVDAEVKDSADRSGIVASFVYGKIQNVFVQVKQNGAWWCGGVAEYVYPAGEISNTIIYVTETNGRDTNLALASLSFDTAIFKDCYSVGSLPLYRTGGDAPVAGPEAENLKNFASLAEFKNANVDLTSWDSSLWDTTSGMPVFKSYLALIKDNASSAIKNDNSVLVNGSLVIEGSNDYVYTLKEEVSGITINGNVVTVVGNYDTKFTVIASNIIDPSITYEKEFTVASKPVVILNGAYNLKLDEASSVVVIEEVALDTISKVLINGVEVTFIQDGTNLTLSAYESFEANTYSLEIIGTNASYTGNVTLARLPYNVLDKSLDFDLSANLVSLDSSLFSGVIQNVTLAGNQLTLDGLNVSGYQGVSVGENTLVVKTDEAIYELKALVVTKVIKSTDDWASVLASKTGPITGYYVLGNDLDYTGVKYGVVTGLAWGATDGFDGVFDGRGFSIRNLALEDNYCSYFGTIGLNAHIKNVEFVNASIAWGGQGGILGNLVYGKIENVSISFASNGGWWTGAIGCFIRSEAKINNVMINVTGTDSDNKSGIGSCIQDPASLTNVYVIGNLPLAYVGADAPGSVLENTTNVAKYADYEALKNASHDFASFDTAIWNLEAGYPYFGKEMPTPEPEPTPDKTDVVLNNSVDFEIGNLSAVINELENDTVSQVLINDVEVVFVQDGSTLTLSGINLDLGDYSIVIIGTKSNYSGKAGIVTKVIKSTADWDQVLASRVDKITGYYVLGNDVDYTGVTYNVVNTAAWGSTAGFDGTFDGRGYSITNLSLNGDGLGFFGTICLNAVIRNVNFKDAVIGWGGQGGVLGNLVYGRIENVAISFTSTGGWWNGGIGCFIRSEARINNVIIQVSGNAGDSSSAIGSCIQDASSISNVYAYGTLVLGYVGADAPGSVLANSTNVAKYDTTDLLVAAAHDYSSFDLNVWDLSSGYPVFK